MERFAMLGKIMEKIIGLPAAFLGALYDLVEKLAGEAGQEWLDELRKFLRKEKCWEEIAEFAKQTKQTLYAILVDFGMSVEELVRLGQYDWFNSDITSEHFPTKRVGKVETKIELLHFDRNISSEEALKEMDKMGYRPAEAHELLAFGAKYPDVQREFPIIALGSVWRSLDGNRRVVCLRRGDAGRGADLRLVRG